MPQSQTAALPIHQEETDKNKQAQIERSGMKPRDRDHKFYPRLQD